MLEIRRNHQGIVDHIFICSKCNRETLIDPSTLIYMCANYCNRPKVIPRVLHNPDYCRLKLIFASMRQRCYNPKYRTYYNYGGRGITITQEWVDNFHSFYYWALSNGYSPDLTIDRVDNDGPYCPENCRWVTMKEQSNNTRHNKYITYYGERLTISQWADKLHIPYSYFYYRLQQGLSISNIITNYHKCVG